MFKPRSLVCILLCALLLLPVTATAEDCFVMNVDTLDTGRFADSAYISDHLSAPTQGIRVTKTISDSNELAASVRLTISQTETGTVIYDKNYGFISGAFDSGIIYLPYVDNNIIPYRVTLSVGDTVYAIPFMHLQPRLVGNRGCTTGARLGDLSPALANGWMMGTMLDLAALNGASQTVPVCASNLYVVGHATFAVSGGLLTVSLSFEPDANVEVLSSAVYLAGDVSVLNGGGFAGLPAYSVGQAIPVDGLDTALLYVPLTVSYDATGLVSFVYNPSGPDVTAQKALWSRNLSQAQ